MEQTAWQGNVLKVTTEVINGQTWERAYLPNGVVVFPVTAEGKILLIKERRLHGPRAGGAFFTIRQCPWCWRARSWFGVHSCSSDWGS